MTNDDDDEFSDSELATIASAHVRAEVWAAQVAEALNPAELARVHREGAAWIVARTVWPEGIGPRPSDATLERQLLRLCGVPH